MKPVYSEGSVFLVPLQSGGYARGVIARYAPRGNILFGYFFGPRIDKAEEANMQDILPQNAILRKRFGYLGLRGGSWIVLGKLPQWDRKDWPMPDFVMQDSLGLRPPRLIRYCDTDPAKLDKNLPLVDTQGMLPDSLAGAGFIETVLTKALAQPDSQAR
jgi:hypothetical protein